MLEDLPHLALDRRRRRPAIVDALLRRNPLLVDVHEGDLLQHPEALAPLLLVRPGQDAGLASRETSDSRAPDLETRCYVAFAVQQFKEAVREGFRPSARLYGIALTPTQVISIVVTVVFTTFAVPGIPGGSIIAMVPVLAAAGLPIDGVGILLAVDTIPDMFRTTANATGTLTVAAVLRADK